MMEFGIKEINKVKSDELLVFCYMCSNYYYEEINDQRNLNSLEIQKDDKEFYKGCPNCKTDKYLGNYFDKND